MCSYYNTLLCTRMYLILRYYQFVAWLYVTSNKSNFFLSFLVCVNLYKVKTADIKLVYIYIHLVTLFGVVLSYYGFCITWKGVNVTITCTVQYATSLYKHQALPVRIMYHVFGTTSYTCRTYVFNCHDICIYPVSYVYVHSLILYSNVHAIYI